MDIVNQFIENMDPINTDKSNTIGSYIFLLILFIMYCYDINECISVILLNSVWFGEKR